MGRMELSLAESGEAPSGGGQVSAEPKPFERLGVRARAKQATRAKLLAAAKALFAEVGYDKATIRDIAAAAGMSTGAVFANFADKFDLFREIAAADMARLIQVMTDAAAAPGDAEERLVRIFTAGYAMYLEQLSLARAMLVVGWTEEQGAAFRTAMSTQPVLDLFVRVLNEASERGELSGDPEAALRAQMLFDTYMSNYRQAVYDGWGLNALQARSREQIRILLAGLRRG
jgi:AcrR family transcriptional regulator